MLLTKLRKNMPKEPENYVFDVSVIAQNTITSMRSYVHSCNYQKYLKIALQTNSIL